VIIPFLLITGVVLTWQSGFVQFRHWNVVWKETIGKVRQHKTYGISSWQALTTALASTIGTGNITGVATAIALGGPGAVFWLWIGAILGMATKYSEIVLAIKYRNDEGDGRYYGGPMYYMEYGLGKRKQACLFAFCTVGACFGIGNMTQANSVALAVQSFGDVEYARIGMVLVCLVAPVLFGGIKRIAMVNSYFVPFMAFFYLAVCAITLAVGDRGIGMCFRMILQNAFDTTAFCGGAVGCGMFAAMRYGLARGVFSNEAGLGSAPIAHSAADCTSAVQQGLWGIFEVVVTMIVCTLTALVVIQSGIWQMNDSVVGADLAIGAFERGLPYGLGEKVVALATIFFAFSSILGWFYYGEQALRYLWKGKIAMSVYKVLYCVAIYWGACGDVKSIWALADILNGLMALPNLVALLLLSKEVKEMTKEFFEC